MATSFEHSRQALTYDETRAASPSVVAPLIAALGPAGGTLVDVGGGTGNYAQALADEGWCSIVVDRNPGMALRAERTGPSGGAE